MKLPLLWMLATALAFGLGGRLGVGLSPSSDIIVTGYLAVTTSLLLTGVVQSLILRRVIDQAGWWVPASLAAVALVGVFVFGVGLINPDVGWVLGVIVGWIALGVLQWLVLREQVAGAGWWVPANVLGLLLAIPTVGLVTWITGAPVETPMGSFLRWLAFGGASGVVTGSTLWWLVRSPPG